MVLAIANDRQFRKFCEFAGIPDLHQNPKFNTNSLRVKNRNQLNKKILKILKLKTIKQWVLGLNKLNVPCGPINNIKQVFDDPQVNSRKMKIEMTHKKLNRKIKVIGNPIKFSESKIKYKKSPPSLGEDTEEILSKFLKLSKKQIKILKEKKII